MATSELGTVGAKLPRHPGGGLHKARWLLDNLANGGADLIGFKAGRRLESRGRDGRQPGGAGGRDAPAVVEPPRLECNVERDQGDRDAKSPRAMMRIENVALIKQGAMTPIFQGDEAPWNIGQLEPWAT